VRRPLPVGFSSADLCHRAERFLDEDDYVGMQGYFNSPRVQEGLGRGSFHYAGERRPSSP
jgi:hypothetical protein